MIGIAGNTYIMAFVRVGEILDNMCYATFLVVE